jgi:hypothetical protein
MSEEGSELLYERRKKLRKIFIRIADIKRRFETGEARTLTPTSVISADSPPPCGSSTQFRVTVCPSRASRSQTPHSVGLLWASDQPVAETST